MTPTLDALAQESAVFSDAIVTGAPTYFSFPGIFASRHALTLGRDLLGIAPGEVTLPVVMRDAGYRTAGFTAGNPYLTDRYGYDQGFGEFHDFMDAPAQIAATAADEPGSQFNRLLAKMSRATTVTAAAYDELYFWYCQWRSANDKSLDELRRYPAADVIVRKASTWLNEVKSDRFFLWIHLMDPHHPYYPPQEALRSVGASEIDGRRARFLNSFWNRGDIGARRLQSFREEIISLYDAGVYWADRQIGSLVSTLKKLGLWDETILVATADHGEEFLEHGARYHSPENLPEQLLRVPLLIRAPGQMPQRIAETFSLLHLAPTLLQGLGLKSPSNFQGHACWQAVRDGTYVAETAISECLDSCNNPLHIEDRMLPRLLAVRDGKLKLVIRFANKTEQLYDLSTDPNERMPLPADAMPEQRRRLWKTAAAHLTKAEQSRNLEFSVRARVRELQYSNFGGKELTLSQA